MVESKPDGIIDVALSWCAEETKRGWDVSPSLASLHRVEGRFLLMPWPIPDEAWASARWEAGMSTREIIARALYENWLSAVNYTEAIFPRGGMSA
jgi:hypothetical protein